MAELLCLHPDVTDRLRKIQTELLHLARPGVKIVSIETVASLADQHITSFFLTRLDELMNGDKVGLVLLRGSTDMVNLLQERTTHPIVFLSIDEDTGEFMVTEDLRMYVPETPLATITLH